MKEQTEKLKNKIRGCLLGSAIGDALGKQNEGLTRAEILRKGKVADYGSAPAGCPGEDLRPGQYTDDTEQMLILATSLVECGGFDGKDFAGRIARWGADARKDPTRKSLIGPSSSIAIDNLISGMNWKESGSNIPSCGSAMRVAPMGLFYRDIDEIETMAALSSIPTHNSKAAEGGAVAVAIGVRCALLDMELPDIIKEVCARTSRYDTSISEKIRLSFEKRNEAPDNVFSELGTSYLINETVPSAFYCFSRHFNDLEKAIIEAINAGGDTDSIACITGALCGVLHGIEAIPGRWINRLENRESVKQTAGSIYKMLMFG